MIEHEIVKIAKAIIKSKVVTVILFVLLFLIINLDYTAAQSVSLYFGSFFIIIALFMFYTNNKKTNTWIKTTGKVVDIAWHDEIMNSGQTMKYGQEIIAYTTHSSKKYTVMNDVQNTKPHKQGESVKIFYNPKNEKEILVYDFFNMYLKFFFLIFFGVIMIYYVLK